MRLQSHAENTAFNDWRGPRGPLTFGTYPKQKTILNLVKFWFRSSGHQVLGLTFTSYPCTMKYQYMGTNKIEHYMYNEVSVHEH